MKQLITFLLIGILTTPLTFCLCLYENEFYIGPSVSYVCLHKDDSEANIAGFMGLDEDTRVDGALYGTHLHYQFIDSCSGFYTRINFNYAQGKLTKRGSFDRYIHQYDTDALFGYELCQFYDWSLIPYIGLSYLQQRQTISDTGIKMRYHIYRIPIGFYTDYCLSNCWMVGFNLAVLPQIDSTLKITLLKGARWDLVKHTDWNVSIPITYQYSHYCLFQLNAFWKRNRAGESKAVTTSGNELGFPTQRWQSVGADINFGFTF